jgi:ABC-type nitrate/sulfonate/bicarbonate transport system substrate-binding protein
MRTYVLPLIAALVLSCGPAATPATPSPTVSAVARETLTLAYSDDPSRVALVWAITNQKVTSPFLDLQISFLPVAQIIPAANTKQFDAIEATPLAVPRTFAASEPGFLILSSGLINRTGTALLTGRTSSIATPADLKGKTVAVASLGGTFVQETRYVLAKKYGLNVDLRTGEVKFAEVPPETVPQLLKDNKLDAAVLTQLGLYRLKDSPDVRVLSEVTKEVQALTGQPVVNSIVVTYKERARSKGRALVELQRMLKDSREYFRANQPAVVKAVAREKNLDEAYLTWFFTTYDLTAGPVTADDARQIAAAWEAARTLGDVSSVPRVEDVLFKAP